MVRFREIRYGPARRTESEAPPEEWSAVSRQAKAVEDIDKLIKNHEPVGEKLKEIVEDHSEASDEIKGKLALLINGMSREVVELTVRRV